MGKITQYAKHCIDSCPYCRTKPEIARGAEIYPHLAELAAKKFWLCRGCGAYVGCHEGTTDPYGRLANKELRRAKGLAHRAFDDIWKLKVYRTRILGLAGNSRSGEARYKAYTWLASSLGISRRECHIGMFDLDMCNRVIEVCSKAKARYGESL